MSTLMDNEIAHTREMLMLHTTSTVNEAVGTLRAERMQHYRFMLQWMVGSIFGAASLGIAAGRLHAG